MVTYEISILKLLVRFLLSHPFFCEVVLCTILKSRSLKSCVALVVFCFSLVVACINPVWADASYPDTSSAGFALYAGYNSLDPVAQSTPIYVPFSGSHTFAMVKPSQSFDTYISMYVPNIEPVSFDRTMVINIGFCAFKNDTVGRINRSDRDVDYYTGGSTKHTLYGGSTGGYVSPLSSIHGKSYCYRVTIPPNTTSFCTTTADDWRCTLGSDSLGFMLVSYGAFLVSSGDSSVVDLVESILAEVQQINFTTGDINSKLSSCLSTLNSILAQCKALNADTDTIITILNAVKSQLVSLNGKVDNIYTLLKDSLKNEADVIDQQSQQVGEQILQRVDSEQYWEDKNTENFNALDMGNWSFGDGVVGALPTVSKLFNGLWDSCGDVVLIFTFPLMLGLALVIIGRISRHSGKGGKSGGDSD